MKNINIGKLKNYLGKEVEIQGFVDNVRNLQYVIFMIVKDLSGKVQITIEKNEENTLLVDKITNLTTESTIKITGVLNSNEHVKLNGMELIPSDIEITSLNLSELPINYKDSSSANIDTRLDYRFLDLRSDKNHLMMQVQTEFVKSMRNYLYQNDFIEIHTPKIIGAASESGSDVFELKYFEKKAYLSQSPQFYKQMAMAGGLERVFEVAPAFRAEKSYTSRHTTEFTSFDLEFSYINSYEDVMSMEENLLINAISNIKEKYGDKIKELFDIEVIVPTKPFPRIKLHDLYNVLKEKYSYEIPGEDHGDLNAEGERLAYQYAMEEYNSEFIFITDYSAEKRAFYHMRKDGIPQGYDLIWRGTEITTGAQREHRYETLISQAKEKGLGKDVEFYLEFFKHGCPPHGGFGLGIDRLTMLLLGIPTIKEAMFVFRGPTRLNP